MFPLKLVLPRHVRGIADRQTAPNLFVFGDAFAAYMEVIFTITVQDGTR